MNGFFPANEHNPAGPFPSLPSPSVIPAPPLSFPRKRESREARSPRGHFSVILSEEKDLPFAFLSFPGPRPPTRFFAALTMTTPSACGGVSCHVQNKEIPLPAPLPSVIPVPLRHSRASGKLDRRFFPRVTRFRAIGVSGLLLAGAASLPLRVAFGTSRFLLARILVPLPRRPESVPCGSSLADMTPSLLRRRLAWRRASARASASQDVWPSRRSRVS